VLDFLRAGDALVVTRIDRLARSIADLQVIVRTIREKGASLVCTEQPVDTSTAAGKAFLDMLGVFAEFETNLRRERQMEGIAKAKAEGVYKGRKPSIDRNRPVSTRRISGCDELSFGVCLPHPGQEFVDPSWIIGADTAQDIGQVGFGVQT
jgi:DNA invertase Pin-like site-specific DNA recombinase